MAAPKPIDLTPPARPPSRVRSLMGLVLFVAVFWGLSQAWSAWKGKELAASLLGKVQAGDITLYTTSSCPYCERARRWLDQHRISYRECNVELEAACKSQYEAKGAPGVPLVNVRDQWRLGFDAQWLATALEAQPAKR